MKVPESTRVPVPESLSLEVATVAPFASKMRPVHDTVPAPKRTIVMSQLGFACPTVSTDTGQTTVMLPLASKPLFAARYTFFAASVEFDGWQNAPCALVDAVAGIPAHRMAESP